MTEHVYESDYKAYVRVQAMFYPDGRSPVPIALWWEDDTIYMIDRVGEIRRAASTKAGGLGIRYACSIRGKTVFLYYEDESQRWFVERKTPKPPSSAQK